MYLQTSQEAKKSKHQREDKRNCQVNIGNEQFYIYCHGLMVSIISRSSLINFLSQQKFTDFSFHSLLLHSM